MNALLHDLLDRAPGTRPAVGHGDNVETYRAVVAASRDVARHLTSHGVQRGDRVIVAVAPDVLVPGLLYGCSRVGAAFCVFGEQAPAPAYAHVLDDAEPALVITENADLRKLAADRGITCLSLADLRVPPPDVDLPAGPIPVDPACLIYTSGSTGLPKAVVSTHAQMTFAVTAIQSQLGYLRDDVVFCALPLSFDYGMYQIFLATVAGARIQLATAADAGPRLLAELHRYRATVLPAVPGMANALARLMSRPTAQPPSLRLMTNTGSAMPDGVLRVLRDRIPTLGIQLMFGLTECKRTTIMPIDGDLRRPGSSGRALPGTEVFAIDPDGRRLPAGEVGELVVRGPHVMAGYWRRPELTAQRFPRVNGLFPELRTGDHGWLDDDGFLYFVGRRDDLYKERGFRVSAIEVAAAATRLDGVEAAAVVPPGGDRETAMLVVVTELAPNEVLTLLRNELEDFKVPGECLVVEQIPVTRNGKVDRAALARVTHV
ncbi:class I adenylate-forming enzyme family protein [Actinocrispum wychmicini]|uniref:Acyl-CoA synthetase (AMP-forming)/AMP-acid ligase II n=1 Tax=Actinocrispum wychmicini TaxID=1213861 RepID=A0A4R2JTS4_9PSEU|nr:class I adenylate-forming enzyme family protein [Actinocrispum wychmicini]TCO60698.1 acyl-CoA synthetase (AMP-forming)/AMP-acid ligase II [Actinocrispum wychmicini]